MQVGPWSQADNLTGDTGGTVVSQADKLTDDAGGTVVQGDNLSGDTGGTVVPERIFRPVMFSGL